MRETYYDDKTWVARNLWRLAFVVVLALIILVWNIYVANNNDGYLRGVVLNQEGQPVEGARVELQEKTINLLKQPIVTTSGEDGRFEYRDIFMIEFVISARQEGVGRAERQHHHLYFEGQNYTLDEPLVLEPAEK